MRHRERVVAVLLVASMGACAALAPVSNRVTPAERARRAMTALQREAFALARYDLLALASDCRSGRYGRDALLLLAAAELDTGNPDGSPRLARHLAAQYLLLPDASPERIPLARSLYRLGADLGGPSAPVQVRMVQATPASAPGEAHAPGEPPSPSSGPTSSSDGPASDSDGAASSPGGPAPSSVGPASSPDPTGSPLLPGLASRFDTCDAGVEAAAGGPLPTTPAPRTVRLESLRAEMAAQVDSLARLQAELTSRADSIAHLSAEIERIRALLKSGLPRSAPRDHR